MYIFTSAQIKISNYIPSSLPLRSVTATGVFISLMCTLGNSRLFQPITLYENCVVIVEASPVARVGLVPALPHPGLILPHFAPP